MKNRLSYYFVKCARQFARLGIALAAAYAFALQVLLASVVVAGTAAAPPADLAAICYASGDQPGQQPSHTPAHLADCALSCAQGLGATAILPDVAPAIFLAAVDTIKGAHIAPDLLARPSPKLAQGPPSNT